MENIDTITNQLFASGLQLPKEWKVTQSRLSGDPLVLEICLDFAPGTHFPDPVTGQLCPVHDTKEQCWRHLNFWQYETILHARVPRVRTPDGKVRQVALPWARPESGFTLLFEAVVLKLAQEMPVLKIAQLLKEQDTRLWRILIHYVNQAHAAKDWSSLSRIQIDETSSRRGHRYVTTILDADTKQLLFMVEGRSGQSLDHFAKELHAHGSDPSKIKLISMDMSPAFIAGAERYFPHAVVVFDHFHITQLAGKAFDEVRKSIWRNGGLTGKLWDLRGNEWNCTEEELQSRREACRQYPKLGRAMMLRDVLQDILATNDEAQLKWWCKRAKRSRLQPFNRLACTLQKHWDGVIAFMKTRITNAAIEAVNGVLQLAKRIARGFRSFLYFRTVAYMKSGCLEF
jgi:transposase